MSYEAWGDNDGDDYDHLLDAGWWDSEHATAVIEAIKALRAEQVYEDGKKENGISLKFLMKISALEVAAGLRQDDDPGCDTRHLNNGAPSAVLVEALESIDAVGCDFGHFEAAARTMQEIARKALSSTEEK